MKIAIVGTAPSSRNLAPFSDPSWKMWVCSAGNMDVPRSDAWFEIHSLDVPWEDVEPAQQVEYLKFLKDHPKLYTNRIYPGFKGLEKYPIEAMIAKYGQYFFTSTVSMMMALAIEHILEARKESGEVNNEIGLFGVDMATDEEYAAQRPGCQFFIRECHLNKISVIIPPESDIAEPPPVYGFCMESRKWRKFEARRNELRNRIAALKAQRIRASTDEMKLQGALEDTEYFLQTWGG